MKISFVITENAEQFVLTPETDAEAKMLDMLAARRDSHLVTMQRGEFYECKGGYSRMSVLESGPYAVKYKDLIVRLSPFVAQGPAPSSLDEDFDAIMRREPAA